MSGKYISVLAAASIALMLTGCADDERTFSPPIKYMSVVSTEESSRASAPPASGPFQGLLKPAAGSSSAENVSSAAESETSALSETEDTSEPPQTSSPETPAPVYSANSTSSVPEQLPEVKPPLPEAPAMPEHIRPALTLPTLKPEKLTSTGDLYFAPGSLNPASKVFPKTGAKPKASSTVDYILRYMTERITYTGDELEFDGDWCTLILTDLMRYLGYDIYRATNPCDLAITLMNNDYADFVCLREENFESLMYYGLKDPAKVKMTAREDYAPQKGDLIVFLWDDADEGINWSHIGIVAEAYDGTVIKTLEGNTDLNEDNEDPATRYIYPRERKYDHTVVGFIRLK